MHTVGIPPARGLQNDQVFAVATLTLPSVGPMSHPSPALPGWCEPEGGTLLGGGGCQDTGALSTLDRRPLCSKQEAGWAPLGKYRRAGEGAQRGVMPPAAATGQGAWQAGGFIWPGGKVPAAAAVRWLLDPGLWAQPLCPAWQSHVPGPQSDCPSAL